MRPKLALIFLFALATIYPSSSCSYKTYAQDEEAGIMTLAEGAGKIAYSHLSDLILAERGVSATCTNETSTQNPADVYAYVLKDIEDDATGDVWLFSGCVLTYNYSFYDWRKYELTALLYAVNGKWALKASGISFGLPGMGIGNIYGLTYREAATYFEIYVAADRKFYELRGVTFNEAPYINYINCDVWDTDGGGVNNIAEWVRGTAIDDWTDDKPSGNACMCGACCRCECDCLAWDGPTCTRSTGEGGCDCHATTEKECTCAKYCCYDTCRCEKCISKKHSQHINGSATCTGESDEGGCDCHKDENPDEECACSKYCCLDKCECKAHPSGEGHVAHQNGSAYCNQGTDPNSGGCSCHGTTDEEECVCSKYCCLDKCECKAHSSGEGHVAHQNGSAYCNKGTDPKSGGCSCHGTTDDEECACSKYCCLDKCECKAHPSGGHGKHQNGLTYCNKGTDPESGGCSCHATEEFDPPEQPDFEELEADERKLFLSSSYESDPKSFAGSLLRLRTELNKKFKFDTVTSRWSGVKFSGELPCFEIELPADFGMIAVDFSTFKEYSEILRLRSILAFGVFFYFISAVIRDIKKFL